MRLDVFVEATGDDYIFSDQGNPVALTAGETVTYSGAFTEYSDGNDAGEGGFVSGSGYYLAFNGESTLGIQTTNATSLARFGDEINCVISGTLLLMEQ